MRGAASLSIKARVGGPDGRIVTVTGRMAWALGELVTAGELGITSFTNPAPRLSHYIFRLRGEGITIETVDEPHDGAFAGSHGRYILRSHITVLERIEGKRPSPPPSPQSTMPQPLGDVLAQFGRGGAA